MRKREANPIKDPKYPTAIPDEVRSDLDPVGGVKGLCQHLPDKKSVEKMSATHNALSDPVRITILFLLAVRPLCVCVIKACIGIADSKLSYHLTVLKNADLVRGRQKGNWIIYRITERGRRYTEETL